MREHGLVQSAAYLGLHGHACWTYEDETDFLRGAAEFLADGERLGQRLLFVGPRGGPRPSLPGLEVLDVEAIYSGGATDADAFLALYSAATDQALTDAVHPAVHGTDVPFRVYAEPDALMLDGQVDFFSADALRRALVGAGGDRPIDLAPLRFADHHAARALAESGAPLRGIPYSMRRVWDLLTKAG